MKEIEKYIAYYLLVYITVLAIFGFFQYLSICQGKSLECVINFSRLNTIITTTAYVLTPIVAIVGFCTWRNQEKYRKSIEFIDLILNKTKKLQESWHMSREHEDISRYQEYCMRENLGCENFDNLALMKVELNKIESVFKVLNDLCFLIDKLHIHSNLDVNNLDNATNSAHDAIKESINSFFNFHQQLVQIKYGDNHSLITEIDMRKTCDRLDRYCDQIMGRENNYSRINHSEIIDEHIRKIIKEIIILKGEI